MNLALARTNSNIVFISLSFINLALVVSINPMLSQINPCLIKLYGVLSNYTCLVQLSLALLKYTPTCLINLSLALLNYSLLY